MEKQEVRGPIQSVSRAAAILRCFLDGRQELSLQEISEMVGLHKSTTSTLVTTLKNEQMLDQDPQSSKYRLGMLAFLLGSNTQINLQTMTQPYLISLNERFRETVNLAAPMGTDIVYINKIESEYSMRICTRIGQRLPFYCTANGKAIFCYWPKQKLEEALTGLRMQKFTENTITDPAQLRRELAEDLANGYSCDNEELEQGLYCYAAPIFSRSEIPVAAISLSGPAFRMKTSEKNNMLTELKRCAAEISELLKRCNYITKENF